MGYRKWRGGFRVPVRRRGRLRRIADVILFCALAVGSIYAIARYLPEREVQGAARVIDGDSLMVNGEEVRLLSIDAPETRQECDDEAGKMWACGREAAKALQRLTRNAKVQCRGSAFDKYGRVLAHCSTDKLDLNREMVRLGFAVSDQEQGYVYGSEQSEARRAKRGIWQGEFEMPHLWRAARE